MQVWQKKYAVVTLKPPLFYLYDDPLVQQGEPNFKTLLEEMEQIEVREDDPCGRTFFVSIDGVEMDFMSVNLKGARIWVSALSGLEITEEEKSSMRCSGFSPCSSVVSSTSKSSSKSLLLPSASSTKSSRRSSYEETSVPLSAPYEPDTVDVEQNTSHMPKDVSVILLLSLAIDEI
jgi:hypothetical protein